MRLSDPELPPSTPKAHQYFCQGRVESEKFGGALGPHRGCRLATETGEDCHMALSILTMRLAPGRDLHVGKVYITPRVDQQIDT